ncbi:MULTISPECIES: glycosyltransferase family 4 protein [Catenuloplanes]|uniref:Glycosyltransferase involved in cell wall biosynthesis n=1 Tax=Catenuloplanes niger TaxID=587534 RepID=A0AAE3ZK73_9ACTN|nr:glycosyltransferase family 4 protein [Catenuloplanes niger]MDR7320211.1 glycosyltransferase involved in cell wall biosynthesis [Catenuloplanes niger]
MAELAVTLLTLGDPATMTGGYLYHRRVADRAPQHGARVDFVSLPKWRFPLPALAGATMIRKIHAQKPDVLLVDSIVAGLAGPWLGAARGLPPIAAILHQPPGGIDHASGRQRTQASLDRALYKRAQRMIIASEDLANTLREQGFDPELLAVVPPGRDAAAEPVDPPGDLRQDRQVAILSVGNWMARKGLLDLLDAFSNLPPNAATLHLVGDENVEPDYASRVRARIARPDLRDRVVTHGVVTPAEVAGFYRKADIFALASTREPYGTVYGEAMAAGLPVVGWNAGNLPHLAAHGVEGLAVPPGDRVALTGALLRLATDDAYRAKMAAAARRKADTFPTWDDTSRMLFTELRALAAERVREAQP